MKVFVIIFYFLVSVFAQQKNQCPEWGGDSSSYSWQVKNMALQCRSACSVNSDCTSIKDPCGRVIILNKIYSAEISSSLKSNSSYQCESRLPDELDFTLECKNKKCAPRFRSCEVETKKNQDFWAENISTECEKDAECTFVLSFSNTCVQRVPLNTKKDLRADRLKIEYMRDAAFTACAQKRLKECDPLEKSFCVNRQCVMLRERPKFKNFVNLEGPRYIANFQSNTYPLKMPRSGHSLCKFDHDCTEVIGVCSQYIVSLNRKFSDSFKKEIEKSTQSIACPTTGKITIPKGKCVSNFCSFVN